MKRLYFFGIMLSFSSFSFAQKKFSFMPENELSREDSLSELSHITEQDFNEIVDQVSTLYKPIVESHGAKLKVVKKWKDPTVNAYAMRSGNFWEVHFFGGLARRREIIKDAFQLVVCHEMGHHLGGYPFVEDWAANDGESDYFSGFVCARELWKNDHKKNAEYVKGLPIFPKKLCNKVWGTKEEKNLCYRVMHAAKSLADLLSGGTAKFETPDKNIVTQTVNTHPERQCRLDTYMAGSICKEVFDLYVIPQTQSEAEAYSCFDFKHQKGARPKCWFKEET